MAKAREYKPKPWFLMRKATSVSLSIPAHERLAELKKRTGLKASQVVDCLLKGGDLEEQAEVIRNEQGWDDQVKLAYRNAK